jgi:flagellar hook-length control protein FliK
MWQKIAARQALPELTAQLPNAVRTDAAAAPATVTTPSAATAYVAPNTGAETRTGADGQGGNNQSLSQTIGSVRNVGQAQAPQAANAPSFAQLLQQAREPILDQVRVQIRTAENRSDIKIQLQPEELGRLEIKMQVGADGKTGVTVTADNKNTLDLLQRDTRGLQQALADAGLKADSGSLSFNLRQGQQEQNQNQAFAQSYRNPLPEEPEAVLAPVIARNYVVNMTDGLDVMV